MLIILALIAPENAMLGRRSFDPFWSSLVGRCKLLISGSVDVANIANLMSVFLADHLSLVFLFVSFHPQPPKTKSA